MKKILLILITLYLTSCSTTSGRKFKEAPYNKISNNKYNVLITYHKTGKKKLFPIPNQYDWKIPIDLNKDFRCWVTAEKEVSKDKFKKEAYCFLRSGAEFAFDVACDEQTTSDLAYFNIGFRGEKYFTLQLKCSE